MSRWVILSIGSDLVLVKVFLRKIQTLKVYENMIFAKGMARPNQPSFQTANMSMNFWTKKYNSLMHL